MDIATNYIIRVGGPQFIQRLPPLLVLEYNSNLTLRCLAQTDEMLDVAYIWTHNGMRIRNKDLQNNPRLHIGGEYLDIINATFSEAGEYECILKSAVGEISSKLNLIVQGPPGPPGGVQVVNVVKTSATLRWTDGALNGKPIIMYTISARTNWNRTWFPLVESKFDHRYNLDFFHRNYLDN